MHSNEAVFAVAVDVVADDEEEGSSSWSSSSSSFDGLLVVILRGRCCISDWVRWLRWRLLGVVAQSVRVGGGRLRVEVGL